MSSVPSISSTRPLFNDVLAEWASVPVTVVLPVPVMLPPDHVPPPTVTSPAPASEPSESSSRATLDEPASVSVAPLSFSVPSACSESMLTVPDDRVTSRPAGMHTSSPAAGTRPRSQLPAVAHEPEAPV